VRRFCLAIGACLLIAACDRATQTVVVHPADQVPDRLSDWGVVFADGAHFELNDGVLPYDLNTPLFSDYALKLRTVWVPDGKTVGYNDTRELDFPVGTIISKTFHYEKAMAFSATSPSVVAVDRESNLNDDGRLDLSEYLLIETRLLIRYAEGWQALPYVWNAAQNEAFLELAGDARSIQLVAAEGTQDITYIVPDANQCAGCHVPDHDAKELRPLGPRAWQLNRDDQLQHWVSIGLLTGLSGEPPHGVRWSQPEQATMEQRAKAYLDANCAHCHNPDGPADTSALNLEIDAPVDRRYGVCKTPVAVGRGSGDRPYDISPGKPDESILLYRMQHSDPAIAMPELGRSVVHAEGVAVIGEWIATMNGDC
jgi:uncharacterized repeat protein (TIGR03806 family)